MSYGSDSPGGSPEGIGGNEAGIGGGGFGGGGGGDFGAGGFGETSYGGLSGNLSGTGATGLGGVGFGGFGDPGTGANFGDVGFGPGGTGYAGQGFLESNIAALGLQGRNINELRNMSPEEQQSFFSNVIEPELAKRSGWQGKLARGILGYGLKGFGNIALPGVGSLATLTGLTTRATQSLMDADLNQALAESLGISKSYAGVGGQQGGENIVSHALKLGVPPEKIEKTYNQLQQKQGGSMGLWEDLTGESAAQAATGAAGTQAGYQQQAIDYLKQMGAVPLAAQQQLAGVYGLPGGTGSQQQMIGQAQASPLYGAIMGGQQAGEESIMRQAGATGGLRSGNVQSALADYNTQLQNQALMQSYGQQMGGLTGLAKMGTYAPQVATGMAGIGGTLAGGQTAAARAEEEGMANLLGLGGALYKEAGGLKGIVGTGVDLYQAGAAGGLSGIGEEIASWF